MRDYDRLLNEYKALMDGKSSRARKAVIRQSDMQAIINMVDARGGDAGHRLFNAIELSLMAGIMIGRNER